ncbi:AmmeMemoRadiSam system protein B [Treponema primitia]|uniref:AmmeMemoRadiSam system protein B n=1 Tax=Treponema primitia TaxID=88058 RepID=UPI0002555935|nr:AmmeMemoRadiSam system protein B [Treponema primitia]
MGVLTAFHKVKGRSPVVSGLFYPDDRAEMGTRIRALGLKRGVGGRASAIIAPHGAWDFSGSVAATAFSAAAGRANEVSRVVILGNVHRMEEPGVFFSDSHYFDTPLGRLPVDMELSESLASCSTLFEVNDIPHLQEIAVEVLLPLTQFCFPGAAIVPILMGGAQPWLISALARALRIILEPIMDSTLLVVSANVSIHDDEKAARLGAETCIQLLEENRIGDFISGIYDGRISSCGASLIASLLESGLMADKPARLVTGPLVSARGELGDTTYYAGIAFESICI